MAAKKGGRMSERAILKMLVVYFLIGCFLASNIMCVCASSEDSTNFFNENKTGSSEYIQKETPKNIETNPSGYMQTNNSKNASSESSNYTETETPENTQIKSSQNTKTESSEYQIKSSENDQIKKPSRGTDLPKSSKPAPPSASVSLHGEKTQVVSGEDILLRLSAVNLITKPLMHVQVIIIPPSGMSVSSSEFVQSGAGQYTTTYDLDPGQGRDIEVRIESNQPGNFNVKGRVIYYFGEDIKNAEDHTLDLPIQVTAVPDSLEKSLEKTIPGFGVSNVIFALISMFILKRNRI